MRWQPKLATRGLLLPLLIPALAAAALLPPRLGDFHQTATDSPAPPDRAVFEEYGLDAAERSVYAAGDRRLEITLWRAKDATGGFGIFQWLRPANSTPVDRGDRGVEAGDTTLFQWGNYVLQLRGAKPEEEHLEAMLTILPRFQHSPAPPVARHLPGENRVPNSERFVQGPVALERIAGLIPPSVAAFHFGAEAQLAEYTAAGGALKMILFTYPTPQIARAQLEQFQQLPGLLAKRSGPLIAAVIQPFSPDEAQRLLAHVRYEATLTWSQRRDRPDDDVGGFLAGVFLLCFLLIGFMVVAGIGLGGVRVLLRRFFPSRFGPEVEQGFVSLHLTDR